MQCYYCVLLIVLFNYTDSESYKMEPTSGTQGFLAFIFILLAHSSPIFHLSEYDLLCPL